MFQFTPELNIGGLSNVPVLLESGKINSYFKGVQVRIHDSLLAHKSGGGLTNRLGVRENIEALDEMLIRQISDLQKIGIGFELLLTNYFASIDDIFDERCRRVLNLMNDQCEACAAVVVDAKVAEYIKLNYPNLLIKWSTTAYYRDKPKDFESYINKYSELCDSIVLPTELNEHLTIVEGLLHPDKIEIMVFDNCTLGCPHRRDHYTLISHNNVRYAEGQEDQSLLELEENFCEKVYKYRSTPYKCRTNMLKSQEIHRFLTRGIHKFKIASRTMERQDLAFYLNRVIGTIASIDRGDYAPPVTKLTKEFERLEKLTKAINDFPDSVG